jgi:hypothetical protein
MAAETIKYICLRLQLYRPFISVTKCAVVSPRRKLWFAYFFEHFEAVSVLLLANCSLPLPPHFFEYVNYFAFCGLEGEVEGVTVGRNRDIYCIFCFRLQMSHSSMLLSPS